MTDADKDPSGTDDEPLLSTLLADSPELWSVVDTFVRTLPDQVTAMQDALRAQAFDRIRAIASELKTGGIDHGYHTVANRAAEIEQAAHDNVVDTLSSKIAEMTALIAKIQAGLRRPGR
ncbi:MAG: Hpt domain-containing protein [Phycisphaerae bacterium]|nr:Hpt domain-containing protein [Phycisphaerae bacterium]